ncbi:hypothetical protein ACFY2R_28450, partial [Micromonospora olivasterospora]
PHHPADEPPTTPASLHPDQPQPTAGSQWVRNQDDAQTLFNQHADHIATTTQQQEQLPKLWNALINHMGADGIITVTESALAAATSTPRQTVHYRIGVLRDSGLLQLVHEARRGVAARYRVSDPGQPPRPAGAPRPRPRQAPLPALPAGSQWVRNRDEAERLFDQHADHIATTTQQRVDQLLKLWNALIDRMDDNGIITASEPALAAETSTLQPTVHRRIVALRDRGLLQLVQESRGHGAARYRVSDPGQPRQASLPAPPEGSQWVRDPDGARRLFDQHADHIATTTRQRVDQLLKLWNVLIDRMDGDGIITATERALAAETSTPRQTVHNRIGALHDRGLLQLVQEAHGGGAARYRVSDPGRPGQASVPGPAPEPDRRPQGSEDLSWLDHGDTSPMSGLVPAPLAGTSLPGLLGDPDAPTASSWQAGRTEPGWPDLGIDVTAHGAGMSTDPGQSRDQAGDGSGNLGDWATWQGDPALDPFDPLHPAWVGPPTAMDTEPGPGPQPMDPTWPQAPTDPTSWSPPSGDQPSQSPGPQSIPPGPGVQDPAPQSPMSGLVPAPLAGTGLPGLPGLLGDPDAPTASSWQAGWTEPGWPDLGIDVTAHGAGMSTDAGQPRIDDQAGEGSGNPSDWATLQGPDMDWQPSPAVTRTDAGTLHAGDTPHHPADEPPTTAPLHPDQPQPQPTADSQWVRTPDDARALFDQHADIATTTQQREQLPKLWDALIDRMDGDGIITASEPALAKATVIPQRTVHKRIVALRDRGLLQLVQEAYGGGAARYRVSDPGQPRQASLPAPPEGSQWVRDRDEAERLFDQHADHIATTTRQRVDQLPKLWNALIDRMDGDGIITASEPAIAAATSIPASTVHNRIVALRDYGLLQLVQEAYGGGAARYRVSDPGQPGQASVPSPAPEPDRRPQGSEDLTAGSRWVRDRDEAERLFEQHVGHIATTTQQREQLPKLWNALIDRMDDDGIITASEPAIAAATSIPRTTVHDRIGALRDRGLLQLVQEGDGGGAARYGVSDPGEPRQASLPALPEGSQWVRNRNDAQTLFDQHVGHIATRKRQRDQLPKLWDALIDRMDGDGIITASEPAIAAATSIPPSTVHNRIVALRDRGLLQLVQEAHGGGAARYRVTDPGRPGQALVPGPAPEPDRRPQGSEDLSWLDHGDTLAPAPLAGTSLPGLPGPLDAPDAPPGRPGRRGGRTDPGWPDPDIDPGQSRIDDQAGDGGNPGAWATWQGPDMRFS